MTHFPAGRYGLANFLRLVEEPGSTARRVVRISFGDSAENR